MRHLERIARQAERWLDNWARVERVTTAIDAMGAQVNELQVVNPAMMCRLIRGTDGRTGNMEIIGNQPNLTESYRVSFLAGSDVRADDRLIINDIVYRVVGLNRASTVYMVAVVVT